MTFSIPSYTQYRPQIHPTQLTKPNWKPAKMTTTQFRNQFWVSVSLSTSVNCHDMHVTTPQAPILVSPNTRLSSSAYMHAIYYVGIEYLVTRFKKHSFCTIMTYTLHPPCQSLIKDVSRKRTTQKSPKHHRQDRLYHLPPEVDLYLRLIGTSAS
jgi:hypothetical protein